jgi:meiotic recombination protein SPO11
MQPAVACAGRGEGFAYDIPSRAKGNQLYVPQLDRIVLKDSSSSRPFASTATCRKAVITTRILQLVHQLCLKRIHVTKRDLFYTDVKLFEVGVGQPVRREPY